MYSLIIVEDEFTTRRALMNLIPWKELGFRVDGDFSDGSDVLEYLKSNVPDVILTDIKMTDISGMEIARRVKECKISTKIVFLSAYGEFSFAQEAMEYGVDHYLLKPVDLSKLRKTFRKIKDELDEHAAQMLQQRERVERYTKLISYEKQQLVTDLYLGSLKSEIYFCIYEKDYEQYVKNGKPIEEADVKNRFEIRLKDDRAKHAIEDILEHEDAGKTAFGIINRYVCFLMPDPENDRRSWKVDDAWQRFIGEETREIRLTDKPEPYTLERTLNWIVRQVAPSFKMLTLLSEIRGEDDVLKKIIDNAKLSPQHKKILKQQQAAIKDMLAGGYVDFDPETGEISD